MRGCRTGPGACGAQGGHPFFSTVHDPDDVSLIACHGHGGCTMQVSRPHVTGRLVVLLREEAL